MVRTSSAVKMWAKLTYIKLRKKQDAYSSLSEIEKSDFQLTWKVSKSRQQKHLFPSLKKGTSLGDWKTENKTPCSIYL